MSIELHHPVAQDLAAREPRVRRQPGLAQQLVEEGARVRDAVPDLRQESAAPALRLSMPDFMRGPGQTVNLPAAGTYLPLTLASEGGVFNLDFTVPRVTPVISEISSYVFPSISRRTNTTL